MRGERSYDVLLISPSEYRIWVAPRERQRRQSKDEAKPSSTLVAAGSTAAAVGRPEAPVIAPSAFVPVALAARAIVLRNVPRRNST